MLSTLLDMLFNRHEGSRIQARERLKLVLAHDRADLTPAALNAMRTEILEVVSRYVELDMEALQIDMTCESGATALIANLPIRRIHTFPDLLPTPIPDPTPPTEILADETPTESVSAEDPSELPQE